MKTQKTFKKALLLTILSGVVALAPQFAKAAEVQIYFNGDLVSMDESQDTYLKQLVENLKTVELAPEYQKALADLKASTSDCTSLKEWRYSKPDLSANFVVKKRITAQDQGNPGPDYSVTLSFPDVSRDSFNTPIEIFSNPSLLTEVSLAKFFKRTLEKVSIAAKMNRLVCTRMVSEAKEDQQKVSSNN